VKLPFESVTRSQSGPLTLTGENAKKPEPDRPEKTTVFCAVRSTAAKRELAVVSARIMTPAAAAGSVFVSEFTSAVMEPPPVRV
jgi:hypothetical protein